MTAEKNGDIFQLGFLGITGDEKQGIIGGYLILNQVGRPVEFHCTSPLRPNRAQEILYGNTLHSFLFGEQIAQALINHTKSKIFAVFTNLPEVLSVQPFVKVPVLFVGKSSESPENYISIIPELKLEEWDIMTRDSCRFVFSKNKIDPENFLNDYDTLFASVDPLEPFERITLAIEEAQKSA